MVPLRCKQVSRFDACSDGQSKIRAAIRTIDPTASSAPCSIAWIEHMVNSQFGKANRIAPNPDTFTGTVFTCPTGACFQRGQCESCASLSADMLLNINVSRFLAAEDSVSRGMKAEPPELVYFAGALPINRETSSAWALIIYPPVEAALVRDMCNGIEETAHFHDLSHEDYGRHAIFADELFTVQATPSILPLKRVNDQPRYMDIQMDQESCTEVPAKISALTMSSRMSASHNKFTPWLASGMPREAYWSIDGNTPGVPPQFRHWIFIPASTNYVLSDSALSIPSTSVLTTALTTHLRRRISLHRACRQGTPNLRAAVTALFAERSFRTREIFIIHHVCVLVGLITLVKRGDEAVIQRYVSEEATITSAIYQHALTLANDDNIAETIAYVNGFPVTPTLELCTAEEVECLANECLTEVAHRIKVFARHMESCTASPLPASAGNALRSAASMSAR